MHKESNKIKIPHFAGEKFVSIGNRGNKNIGDELILLGVLNRLGDKNITISTLNPIWLKALHQRNGVHKTHHHLSYIHELPHGIRSALSYIVKGKWVSFFSLLRADTFVLGGGELFTEETPGSYEYWMISLLPYRIRKIFMPRKTTRLYVMGGMQHPLEKNKIRTRIFKTIVKHATAVYCRDQSSVDTCRTWTDKAELVMDSAYSAHSNWGKYRQTQEHGNKHIVVNLIPLGRQFDTEIQKAIDEALDKGWKVTFLAAYLTKHSAHNDLSCYEELKQKYGNQISLLDRENNLENCYKIIGSAEKVWCCRLHIFLITHFIGTPVHVFGYQKKIEKMKKTLEELEI